MRHNYFLIGCLMLHSIVFSQIGPKQIISNTTDQPQRIAAADIDGDGDLDVISGNQFGSGVTWHENIDGQGNFGPDQIITTETVECQWVHAEDLDGDGDIDVLSASWEDDKIAWYENLDGLGSFGPQQIITNSANTAESVSAADLDGDGDMDVISASRGDGHFKWYENLDGNGTFNSGTIINSDIGAVIALPADIDNDGDIDIVACSSTNDKVHWYKNLDGQGNFSGNLLITDVNESPWNISIGDIDGDNDLDVAFISLNDATIYWAENTDGQGNFNLAQTMPTPVNIGYSIELIDIDDDGDLDLFTVYGGNSPGILSWRENTDGLGLFSSEQIIDPNVDFPTTVIGADISGDGKKDILMTISFGDEVVWYENLFSLSINDEKISRFTVFPIPTSGILNIETSEDISSITIFTITGKKVLHDSYKEIIDLSSLSAGIYLLQISTINGKVENQRIIKY